jgi:hypothetical protein
MSEFRSLNSCDYREPGANFVRNIIWLALCCTAFQFSGF